MMLPSPHSCFDQSYVFHVFCGQNILLSVIFDGMRSCMFWHQSFLEELRSFMPGPSAWTKLFLSRQNFYLHGKWMENDFLAITIFFPQLKSLFLSFSQANMNFLAWEKNFSQVQKIFCPGQFSFCPSKKLFRPGRRMRHWPNYLMIYQTDDLLPFT